MKSISKILLVAILLSGFSLMAGAQKKSGKLEVKAQLTEVKGTYDQRKLYRDFLTEYMTKCPYISHFSIREAVGSSDNHKVVWSYQVDSWEDITKFYHWVSKQIGAKEENGLAMAMTPYAPDYNIGGRIHVGKTNGAALARK